MALTQISTKGIKDGTITGSDLATNVDLVDDQKLRFGTGNDLQIYHTGSNSNSNIRHINSAGSLYIDSANSTYFRHYIDSGGTISFENFAVFNDDGAVELYHNNVKSIETISTGVGGAKISQSINIYRSAFGNGNIQNTVGNLYIEAKSGETSALFVADGAVELYFDNSKKLETTNLGVTVTGNVTSDELKLGNTEVLRWGSSDTAYIQGQDGASGYMKFGVNSVQMTINRNGTINLPDNNKITFGASDDLQIYHNGTDSYIENSTGDLKYKAAAQQFIGSNNENMIIANQNGAVELYYDGSKKFETTSAGATVTGSLTVTDDITLQDDLLMGDQDTIKLGDSVDLQIQHDGTDSHIKNLSGETRIQCANIFKVTNYQNTETYIKGSLSGSVELYHDNSKKFETTANGVKVNDRFEIRNGVILDNTANGNNCGISFNGDGIRPTNGAGTETDNTYDLGHSSFRWRNIYTTDLNLSNEGSANDVDGSWGSYTIQEGAENLFLINKRNGKKYKFNLTEVS